MKLVHLCEDAPKLGQSVEQLVFRSGPMHQYGTFMNFGSEKAAQKAATGQNRELYRGTLILKKVAILQDSKAAHDVNPDRLAADLVTGGTFPEQIANYVKKVKDEKGVGEAFSLLRKALENKGYDGIAYTNVNEDPGSTSYMIWDPSKFKRLHSEDELITMAEKVTNEIIKTINWESWTSWGYRPMHGQHNDNIIDVEIYGGKKPPTPQQPDTFHDDDDFEHGPRPSVGCEVVINFTENEVGVQPLSFDATKKAFKLSDINGIANKIRQYFELQQYEQYPPDI